MAFATGVHWLIRNVKAEIDGARRELPESHVTLQAASERRIEA